MKERFETFTVLMAAISRSIRKIKTQEMAQLDLKSIHVSCLYYLYKADTLTASQLCDISEEDKANVSRSIKYLEENGYIHSETQNKKRYQTPLVLTEKGRTYAKQVAEKIDRILALASDGLSEHDRRVMYSSLSLISENLQRICSEYEEGATASK